MNSQTKFFATKDEYLNFRKAFAAAQNDPRAKRTTAQGTQHRNDQEEHYTYRVNGWLTGSHFVLYNIIRARDFHIGFTPKTNKNFIENGGACDQGLWDAVRQLKFIVQDAQTITSVTKQQNLKGIGIHVPSAAKHASERLSKFLHPFNNTLSIEQLAAVDVDVIKIANVNWKYHSSIEQLGQKHIGKRITFTDLFSEIPEDHFRDQVTAVLPASATSTKKSTLIDAICGFFR